MRAGVGLSNIWAETSWMWVSQALAGGKSSQKEGCGRETQRWPRLGLLPGDTLVWDWTHPYSRFGFSGIRDVSKWSEKARKPLEALYGYDYFAKTCEKWVDGINQFKHLPEGMLHGLVVPLLIAGQAWVLPLASQHSSQINKPHPLSSHWYGVNRDTSYRAQYKSLCN